MTRELTLVNMVILVPTVIIGKAQTSVRPKMCTFTSGNVSKTPYIAIGSSSPTCHYRQSTSDEAERLELYNRPSETRSSCFGQDLKGQSERRGRSISRTGSARSNSRPSLSSTHSHKRRRQRSRSKSISRDSKSRKHKRSPKESRRSVLTGKKVNLDLCLSLL